MSTINYLTIRNTVMPSVMVTNANYSTLSGSSITVTSTITTSTLLYSTLIGRSITTTTLSLSTLTVSSINNNAPGTGSFSTLTVSSLVSVSSIQTASTMYTSSLMTTGNVGIGITTPSDLLVVNSGNMAINTATTTAAGYLFNQGSVWGGVEVEGNTSTGAQTLNFGVNMNRTKAWNSSYGGLFLRVDSRTGSNYNGFHFFNRSAPSGTDTEIVTILSGGNVGIGAVNPGYALHVIGAIYASGNITALSDQRYKQNIVRLADCLGKVSRLSAYQYTRTDYLPGVTQIGLIAQEVNDVFPEAVSHDVTNDTYSLNYGCLIAPVIESIKEIDQKVDSRVTALESKIAAQQVLIQQLLVRLG